MTREEIQEQIKTAISKGDWYDIVQVVKKDEFEYALHYLAVLAIKQDEQLYHIREWAKEWK